jgi:hypothetical protein
VQVSKPVVVATAAIFLVLFGLVLFLLGRESSRSAPPPATTAVTSVPVPTPAPATPVPTPPPAAVPAVQAPAPAIPATTAPPTSGEAAAVRAYFAQIQAIQTLDLTGDAGEYANKVLAASMTGDSSGFDDLVRAAESGAARARAIAPPPACAAYHRQLLAMLGDSIAMVRGLKSAIGASDSAALGALAASGMSLQSRANALEAEEAAIKTRFGLAR